MAEFWCKRYQFAGSPIDPLVVIFGRGTGYFFECVSGHVSRTLVRNVAEGGEAERPKFFERFRAEDIGTAWIPVGESSAEKYGVEVGSTGEFAVLPTSEEPSWTKGPPESVHKFLVVTVIETYGTVGVIVSKGDERVVLMQ